MAEEQPPEGWATHRLMILRELERISRDLEILSDKLAQFQQDEISKIKVDIAMLQVKAGAWGAISGLVVALAAVLLRLLSGA